MNFDIDKMLSEPSATGSVGQSLKTSKADPWISIILIEWDF